MPYPPMTARMIDVVAYQKQLTAMWDGDCPGGARLHVARHKVGRQVKNEPALPRLVRGWAGECERCGVAVPWEAGGVRLGGGVMQVWDTVSGKIEPGCLYWSKDYEGANGCFHWDNCDGRHLHAMLPNGSYWDIDGRARNCSLPDDRQHRCWVRSGEPPKVTAGKAGNTCSAGAGSIAAGDYHGFLIDGVFTAG